MKNVLLSVLLVCIQIVVNNTKGMLFSEIDNVKFNKAGLLLGTPPPDGGNER
jgi:vancomycin permeability regulator SanA